MVRTSFRCGGDEVVVVRGGVEPPQRWRLVYSQVGSPMPSLTEFVCSCVTPGYRKPPGRNSGGRLS